MTSLLLALPVMMGAPANGAAPAGSMFTTFITFGLIILIFYFLIIRPQKRKEKQTKDMLSMLKKGDKVSTIGGIRGTVLSVREATVVVKVDDATKLEFSKGAIANVLNPQQAQEPQKEEEPVEEIEAAETEKPAAKNAPSKPKKGQGKKGGSQAKKPKNVKKAEDTSTRADEPEADKE